MTAAKLAVERYKPTSRQIVLQLEQRGTLGTKRFLVETISFSALIETTIENPANSEKRLSGKVSSFAKLLDEENLRRLEEEFSGVFGFLAFHPSADTAVAEYVRSGTLGSDSGPRVLVLYTLDPDASPHVNVAAADGLKVDLGIHPAYEMVRLLFEPKPPPPLPGIVFVSRFTGVSDAVYVSVDAISDQVAMRSFLRVLFAAADEALGSHADRAKFPDSFSRIMQRKRFQYTRSSRVSLREWLIRTYQFAANHKSDIVAILNALP